MGYLNGDLSVDSASVFLGLGLPVSLLLVSVSLPVILVRYAWSSV